MRSVRHSVLTSPLTAALVLYLLSRPLLGFAHELSVAGCAWVAHALAASNVWQGPLALLRLDPIYGGAAIRALGGVEVLGLAVAGPIGSLLHTVAPALFLTPDRVAHHAGISMVAGPGAPALGRGLAAFSADVLWLVVGLVIFRRWFQSRPRLALVGLFMQAQIAINHLLNAHLRLADIDASGLPLAVQLATPNGVWFTTALMSIAPDMRDLLLGIALVGVGYACALSLVYVPAVLGRFAAALRTRLARSHVATESPLGSRPRSDRVWSRRTILATSSAVAIATAWSPVGAVAHGISNWQPAAGAIRAGRIGAAPSLPSVAPVDLTRPTPVSVRQTADGTWQYVVDGQPRVVRGVGYNPQYAGRPSDERATLYERDFAAMHRLGVTTIEGWFETQFDAVTLDSAARNGIGVLMPFELNQDWDFTNPNVQQSILDHVSAHVEQYKHHPAVRMWAPGNENLHRVLYARWVSQEHIPEARARADAFASFLPRLIDRIHALDPDHPVVYRDAEDVYLGRVVAAFAADGVDRPWLVYGANVYSTPRLQAIIGAWPSQWPGHALLISEFAPGGAGPIERPLGFQQQWAVIRQASSRVLGGLAYTWATNGPEDLDRVFGLVDPQGVPTDGALAALSASYLSDLGVTARRTYDSSSG